MQVTKRDSAAPDPGRSRRGRGALPLPELPEGRYVAVLGGSETCGRAVATPYPSLLQQALELPCINLGQQNASMDLALSDWAILQAYQGAALTVVAVTGAANLSNRLYNVHPRRNDRFLKPSPALRVLFPEVDFAEICFTRHLLLALHEAAPDRFDIVREELQKAWTARMQNLLGRIGGPVLLLWDRGPEGTPGGPLGPDPLFVTPPMIEAVGARAARLVRVPPGCLGERTEDAHARIAAALLGPVRAILPMAEEAQGPS